MKDEYDKFARAIAQETLAAFEANKVVEPARRRGIDWVNLIPTLILLIIAIVAAFYSVLIYFFDAQSAPMKAEMSLVKQAQVNIKENMKSGFEGLNKKMDLLMGPTAGVTPEENDRIESLGD